MKMTTIMDVLGIKKVIVSETLSRLFVMTYLNGNNVQSVVLAVSIFSIGVGVSLLAIIILFYCCCKVHHGMDI